MDHGDVLAAALGDQLRLARRDLHRRQADIADHAGVSQATASRMELGGGGSISIDTWAKVAAAAGLRLTAGLIAQTSPECQLASPARRCHALIADFSRQAGWTAVTVIEAERIETVLSRPERDEVAVIRVWDDIASVPAANDDVLNAVSVQGSLRGPTVRVGLLVIALRTPANRRRITESRSILRDVLPTSGTVWMRALEFPRVAMPSDPGLIWAFDDGARLKPVRHRPGWERGW